MSKQISNLLKPQLSHLRNGVRKHWFWSFRESSDYRTNHLPPALVHITNNYWSLTCAHSLTPATSCQTPVWIFPSNDFVSRSPRETPPPHTNIRSHHCRPLSLSLVELGFSCSKSQSVSITGETAAMPRLRWMRMVIYKGLFPKCKEEPEGADQEDDTAPWGEWAESGPHYRLSKDQRGSSL